MSGGRQMRKHALFVFLVLQLLTSCVPEQAGQQAQAEETAPKKLSPLIADTTVTVNGEADTYIREWLPLSNFGTKTYLHVAGSTFDGWSSALVRVKTSDIVSAVAPGAQVESAFLELTADYVGPGWEESTVSIHAMKKAWNETTATWYCANPGLFGVCSSSNLWSMDWWNIWVPVPFEVAALDEVELSGTDDGDVVRFDVTSHINRILLDPASNNGWLIKNSESFDFFIVDFKSRESGSSPRLVITSRPLGNSGDECNEDMHCKSGLFCDHRGGLSTCTPASCDNGIRDPSETGVDCGGSCDACPPPTACAEFCEPGEDVPPVPTAVLSFSSGTFSRPTYASYQSGVSTVVGMRPDFLRYEDRGDGNHRVALFEGARTNHLLWSREYGVEEAWGDSPVAWHPYFPANDELFVAPDGRRDAHLVDAKAGGQSLAQEFPAGPATGTLSVWQRLAEGQFTTLEYQTRLIATGAFGAPVTNSVEWELTDDWSRFWKRTTATASNVFYSHAAGWPEASDVNLPDVAFHSWGFQLEEGNFPSSFIWTEDSKVTRAADVLTFASASIPSWLRNGIWQFDVYPIFSSGDVKSGDRFVLFSFGSSSSEVRLESLSSTTAGLVVRANGVAVLSRALTWSAHQKMTITLNATSGQITIRGATTGNGVVSTSAFNFTGSPLRVGGRYASTSEAFARISEPRRVTAAFATCMPSLNRCSPECPCGPGDGHCDSSAECTGGTFCAAGFATRYGLPSTYSVCVPEGCGERADGIYTCGTKDDLCGECPTGCMANCTQRSCGPTNCYGSCGDTCGPGEAGCATNMDCEDGLVCVPFAGWRFGLSSLLNVCMAPICESISQSIPCGTITSPCGLCPTSGDQCGTRDCGDDGFGHDCGSCPGEHEFCSEGECVEALTLIGDWRFEPPPGTGEGDHTTPDGVGSTPGSLMVDINGNARYVVNLELPPGRAGLKPGLSLAYSSGGADGYLGVGWSLNGLSSITRCVRTIAQDGEARGVEFTDNDRFCLDGNKLVLVAGSGDYGEDGSEYRTELEEYSKIVAHGDPITSFTVYQKGGNVLTYGSTPDSLIGRVIVDPLEEVQDADIHTWAVSKVADRLGNYIAIGYESRATMSSKGWAREHLPLTISYTGFDDGTTEVAPSRFVKFVYQDAADPRWGYRHGSLVERNRLLDRIDILVNDGVVRSYDLAYQEPGDPLEGETIPLAILESITECVPTADDDDTPSCKLPMTFGYETPGFKWGDPEKPIGFENAMGQFVNYKFPDLKPDSFISSMTPADLNGNGIDDLIFQWREVNSTGTWGIILDGEKQIDTGIYVQTSPYFALTNPFFDFDTYRGGACDGGFFDIGKSCDDLGSAQDPEDNGHAAYSGETTFTVMDVDNDGDDDILEYHIASDQVGRPTSMMRALSFDADDEELDVRDTSLEMLPHRMMVLDADGDGLRDILQCEPDGGRGTWRIALKDPAGDFDDWREVSLGESPSCLRFQHALAMDMDRDGAEELLLPDATGDYALYDFEDLHGSAEGRRIPTTLSVLTGNADLPFKFPKVMDFNGDGLPDFMQLAPGEDIVVNLNRGSFDHDGWLFSQIKMDWPAGDLLDGWTEDPALLFGAVMMGTVVTDVDGDGRQDYITPTGRSAQTFLLWRSNGESFDYQELSELDTVGVSPGRPWFNRLTTYDADGDGRQDLGFLDSPDTEVWTVMKRQGPTGVRMTSVSSGGGSRDEITYKHMTDSSVYEHGSEDGPTCTDQQQCVVPRGAVVVEHRSFDTESAVANEHFSYRYKDARQALDGRGWLGFAERTITDEKRSAGMDTATTQRLTYDNQTFETTRNTFPGAGKVKEDIVVQTVQQAPGEVEVLETTTSYDYEPFITPQDTIDVRLSDSTIATRWTAVGSMTPELLSERESTWGYDDYGNVTLATTKWRGPAFPEETLQVTIDYWHEDTDYVDEWLIHMPQRRVEAPLGGEERIQTFDVYAKASALGMSGLYEFVRTEPDDADMRTVTQLTHDDFGNPLTTMISGDGEPTRQTEFVYDDEGIFPEFVTNNGQTAEVEYHPALGVLVGTRQEVVLGEDPLVNRWYYDYFGRIREVATDAGVSAQTSYQQVGTLGAIVTTTSTGRPDEVFHLDALGREIQREVEGFSGQLRVDTHYDDFGNVDRQSRPYRVGTTQHNTIMVYDELARLRGIEAPDGTVRETCYWAGASCQVDEVDHVRCVVRDARGRVHRTYDQPPASVAASGQPCLAYAELAWQIGATSDWKATVFEYDDWGTLERVIDKEGNATSYINDRYGRPTSIDDPDMGMHGYVYNPFGSIRQHSDGNGDLTTYEYDAFRRPTERRHIDGLGSGSDAVATWHWDSQVAGSLDYSVSSDGVRVDFTYTNLARPETATWNHDSTTQHTITYQYDAADRLERVTYPGNAFAVEYKYNSAGHLEAVFDTRDMSDPIWAAVAMADDGQINRLTLGHVTTTYGLDPEMGRIESISANRSSGQNVMSLSYTYFDSGDLQSRSGLGAAEQFTYDSLGRLEESVNNTLLASTHHYGPTGNIDRIEGFLSPDTVYHYESSRPHAVTRVVKGPDEDVYSYDGNGSVIGRTGTILGDLTIEYNRASKPTRIFSAADESDAIDFTYDAELNRVRKIGALTTRSYVPGLFEEVVANDGVGPREQHYMVQAGGAQVAELIRIVDGTTVDEHMLYVHNDHLGSVRRATDVNGVQLQSYDYEPFGGIRNTSTDPSTPGTDVSFTGHELDSEFGLINMGGRIYDPRLERFLSADPHIVAPYSSQSQNRYSYALNNPLRFTDPSGFSPELCDELNPFCQGGPIGGSGMGSGADAAVDEWLEFWENLPPGADVQNAEETAPADTNTSILDTPLGTGGKVAVVSAGAVVGAGMAAGIGWGTAYATTLACGPAAAACAGVVTVGLLGYGAYSLVNGGWDSLSASFSRVFSSEEATVGDALTVGTTLGAVGQGLATSGAFGPAAAARSRGFVQAGRASGAAHRARIVNASRQILAKGPRICFAAGTLILMADGTTLPIEDVSVGDWVFADDPEDDELPSAREVTELHRTATYRLFRIAFGGDDGGVVEATGRHPFWTERGWIAAEELTRDDHLLDDKGRAVEIDSIAVESRDAPTFNLSVEGVHTYFVVAGNTPVLVHNLDPWDIAFSRPVDANEVFSHGPWKGRTVAAAIVEARAQNALPEGLQLNAARYFTAAGEEVVAATNNRTLYVAQEAGLTNVNPVNDIDSSEAFRALQKQLTMDAKKGGSGSTFFRCR